MQKFLRENRESTQEPVYPMVQITSSVQPEPHHALFSPALAAHCGMMAGKDNVIFLRVGKIRLRLETEILLGQQIEPPKAGNLLCLHEKDRKSVGLELRQYGFYWEESKGELHLGPVVGIMAEVDRNHPRLFHKQTHFFEEMLEEAEKCGEIAYVFPPEAATKENQWLEGYVFQQGHWQKRACPFPEVIYPRHSGYAVRALKIRERMKRQGVHLINPPLIGKWKTACILQKYPELQRYLPETLLLKDFSLLEEMLKKWSAVYLKPINGSQGKNIIRVSHHDAGYQMAYTLSQHLHRDSVEKFSQLKLRLRRILSAQQYILQQPIALLRVDGGVADVRVVVQKDHKNRWQVTGKAFRAGKKGSITSNISSGGSAYFVENVLKNSFPELRAVEIAKEIDWLALTTARRLEEGIAENVGEFGVDIGVDTTGKIWLIEANLKPGRQVFSLLGDGESRLHSVRNPLLYARWLTGFEGERKGAASDERQP